MQPLSWSAARQAAHAAGLAACPAPVEVSLAEADDRVAPHRRLVPGDAPQQLADLGGIGPAGLVLHPGQEVLDGPTEPALDIHYACYQAKPVIGEAKFTPVTTIRTDNQFGPEALEAKKERELCLPALKNPCGDGITQAGVDECDDGNLIGTDGCTGSCTICGNNTTTPPTWPSFSSMAGIMSGRYRAGADPMTRNAICQAMATERKP